MDHHGPGSRPPEPDGGSDEGSIVARAQDGELAAFEHLVLAYQDRLFRLAYRMLEDRGEAEDVVQETLATSWQALPMLADVDAFGAWVYRMATNKCLDVLRRRSAHGESVTDPDRIGSLAQALPGRRAPGGTDPAHEAEWSAQQNVLAAVLGTLPPAQRACWLLREMHGRSYAEIGATLKISPTTVRGMLARARHRIAEGMSQWR
jgi:RNA polymerase sigma-70 factor (ECF subfamily)